MKHLKTLGLAALAATALTALAASSASATTLEVAGKATNETTEITGNLAPSSSAMLSLTGGGFANTCTAASGTGKSSSPFTGASIGGSASSASASFCTRPITVHKPGGLTVQHISSSTNGTVLSSGAESTVSSPIGTLTCITGGGTHIGTLTGSASGQATVDVNAVINCGFLAPSAVVTAKLVGGSSEGAGITS